MTDKIVDVNSIVYGNYSVLIGVTESNELLIAQPTVEILMGWESDSGRKKIVSKSLKDFAGLGFKVGKNTQSVNWVGQGKTVFYNYSDFLVLVKWQVKQGNDKAIDLVIAGFADSFSEFAYKSFGLVYTEKERQLLLKSRQKGIQSRRTWTDAVQEWLGDNEHLMSSNERKFVWIHVSDAVNIGIFGRNSTKLKSDWKLPKTDSIRDHFTEKELMLVEQIENTAMRILDKNGSAIKPIQAIQLAVSGMFLTAETR